jgi:hypothetical protein
MVEIPGLYPDFITLCDLREISKPLHNPAILAPGRIPGLSRFGDIPTLRAAIAVMSFLQQSELL